MQRDGRALERIADALERWATVAEKRFEKEFPEARAKRDAELIRADERADQYSDKPTDQWFDERPKDAEPTRFAKRLEENIEKTGKQTSTEKRRGSGEVPQGDRNKNKPS